MPRMVRHVDITTDPPTVTLVQENWTEQPDQRAAPVDHTHAGGASHPDLATHDALGLATDTELAAHAAASNPHPNYATDGDLAAHVADPDPHTQYALATELLNKDVLVATATGDSSDEIVVGTSPGGELGGTWASPTVDASHSGSTHAATQAAAEATAASAAATHAAAADPHTGYQKESEKDAASGYAGLTASSLIADAQIPLTNSAASTQALGDAAAIGSGTRAAHSDHKHGLPALGTTAAAIGTSAGGSATTPSKSDHVHATGAGTPSTQAFGDAAATGSGPAAAMTDHKHAMPTLGYGLTGNGAPVVGLSSASGFVATPVSVSAATFADLTGASVSLVAGTWLIVAQVYGSAVNLAFLMHAAITDGANAILSEGSQFVPASGTASVNAWGSIAVHALVTPSGTTTYKLRAARGLTTLTNTWTAQDGAGVNVTNNASDNTDKGTAIFAIRIA